MTSSSRAAMTSTAIENAAIDLAVTHGYARVTVDMICEVAGVSQRTFFNHFPTKEDALLGLNMPQVDQRAARRFVATDGPLLLDAINLIDHTSTGSAVPRLTERLQVISTSPTLLARQMERIGAIEVELREIIDLRLERQHPELADYEREDRAALLSGILAGIMRFIASMDARGEVETTQLVRRARTALAGIVTDSIAPTESPLPTAAVSKES